MTLKDYFNFMAQLIHNIHDQDDYIHYFTKSLSWYEMISDSIEENIPSLFQNVTSNTLSLYELKQIEVNVLDKMIHAYLEQLDDENTTCGIMKLLEKMDELVKQLVQRELFLTQPEIKTIDALNDNYEETRIAILPYVDSAWQRKGRSSQHGYTINHCMHDLYYIELDHLKLPSTTDYLQTIHVLVYPDTLYKAQSRDSLIVSISPVTKCEIIEEIKRQEDKNGNCYFEVKGLKNSEHIMHCVLSDIDAAVTRETDILIFPELLGSESLNEKVLEKVKTGSRGEYPSFIILPSVWKQNKNVADILLGSGLAVFKQSKQIPMVFEGACENIHPDNTLYVIHCPGIGRICVLICKDMLSQKYLDIVLNDIRASLIIVPSFSTGSFDFRNAMVRCQAFDCHVAWINSCAALHLDPQKEKNFKTVGMMLHSGYESNRIDELIRFDHCKKRVGNICLFDSKVNFSLEGWGVE